MGRRGISAAWVLLALATAVGSAGAAGGNAPSNEDAALLGGSTGGVTPRVHPAPNLAITKAKWDGEKATLEVEGKARPGAAVTVASAASGTVLGVATASRDGKWKLQQSNPRPVPCRVRASSGGQQVEAAVAGAPATCDGAGTPSLASLTVSGPASVEEGSTARFLATASYTDGTTKDVSAAATWGVDPPVAAVAQGVVTAGAVDADVQVRVSATCAEGGISKTASAWLVIQDRVALSGSHAGRFTAYEGTKTCLTCHLAEATDIHGSVHYQWRGEAGEALGLSTSLAGKLGGINDFCIYPDINWIGKLTNLDGQPVDGGCARCHTGLGGKPSAEPTQAQLENIDCLLCHSKSYKRTVAMVDGAWRFVPDTAAMQVSLLQAAVDITKPDSGTCLNCHTRAGGGNNFKRGDLEEAHRTATADFDVHMAPRSAGGAGLSCLSCHVNVGHRIAGRGVDMRERDLPDRVACTNCHAKAPHGNSKLNDHTARVSCTVCHIPEFAKVAPTDLRRDYSAPAEVVAATRLYEPHMLMASHVRPVYRFFNGTSQFYEFGAEAIPEASGRISMAKPLGSINDRGAQIVALKHHTARQPIDPVTRRLLPLKIGIFFQTGNLAAAVQQGVAEVGWPDNGFEFAETERFLGIYHEVAPAQQALACTSCHGGGRMDFAALGYAPLTTRNGKPLCASCHSAKTADFYKIHDKHVRDKHYDCSTCHTFSKAVS